MNDNNYYSNNSNNNIEEKKNSKVLPVIISVIALAMLVLGIVGYFIQDKSLSNKNDNNNNNGAQIETMDFNSSIVKNLVYPGLNRWEFGLPSWEYREINTIQGRDWMMAAASSKYFEKYQTGEEMCDIYDPSANGTEDGYGRPFCWVYASKIEDSFKSVFGPDITYYDSKFEFEGCVMFDGYDQANKAYTISGGGCGGDTAVAIHNESKLYKAEQSGDEIYTYFYVQSYAERTSYRETDDVYDNYYLYKRETDVNMDKDGQFQNYIKKSLKTDLESTIQTMMDNGEVDTYKFTFKKQSDGKYYFYSGNWE